MKLRPKTLVIGLVLASVVIQQSYATDASPVIVVPGHVGVPVILDGVDATGAVVYGDWGLSRPGHGHLVIEGVLPPARLPERPRYFPSGGGSAVQEEQESPPPRSRGSSAADYHRSWTAGSSDLPGTMAPLDGIAPGDGYDRSRSPRPAETATPDPAVGR
jgi:hypothetical protein